MLLDLTYAHTVFIVAYTCVHRRANAKGKGDGTREEGAEREEKRR